MAAREEAAEFPAAHDAPARTSARWKSIAASMTSARFGVTALDLAIVIALTAGAAVLRLWHLGTVPLGLHGDEAWTGLDARRILDEGWIGVYVDSALGQPTGPLYFTAALFRIFPDTTFTLRASMALVGIATIPLAYVAFSLMFNRTVGAFGALLLAVMTWHLQLSRTGFMVITWPFMEIAVLLATWLAFRMRSPWLFLLAGALLGLGVYSYNAYLLFIPVAFVPIAWFVLEAPDGDTEIRAIFGALLFAAAALLFALPLVRFVSDNTSFYERHQRVVGVTHSEQWDDGSVRDKADIIWDRAREWNSGLVLGDRPDQGDGLAEHGFPPIEPVVYVLAIVGLAAALWNIRRKEYAVCVAAVAVLPWGALLTVGDGVFRRSFGLAPFVALLAAIPLAWAWNGLLARRNGIGYAGMALVLVVPAFAGARAVHDYFGPVQDTATMRIVYPYQLDAAARWMRTLPEGTHVYFYSDRWSIDYETVQFLAPGVDGEDRSREFRPLETVPDGGALRTDIDRGGPVAFVMLGDYLPDFDRIVLEHPGGTVVESRRGEDVLFLAYVVGG